MSAPMEQLISALRIPGKCVIEATVVTGFEINSKLDVLDKIPNAEVITDKAIRGRIFIIVDVDKCCQVLDLGSIDNCFVVMTYFQDVGFSENDLVAMSQIRELVRHINWKIGLEIWSQFFTFSHPIEHVPDPIPDSLGEASIVHRSTMPKRTRSEKKNTKKNLKKVNHDKLWVDDAAAALCVDVNCDLTGEDVLCDIVQTRPACAPGDLPHINNSHSHFDSKENNVSETSEMSPDDEDQPRVDKYDDKKYIDNGMTKSKGDSDINECSMSRLSLSQEKQRSERAIRKVKQTDHDPTKPTFRVTCDRAGPNHSFQSMCAAANFGGAIYNYFHWNVDMKKFDIEVVLKIDHDDAYVCVALTRESLHRRHLAFFGPTALRPTIAYNMLRLLEILPGDVVCDPMCGGGSIPIEGAVHWPHSRHIGGELHQRGVARCRDNVQALNRKRLAKGKYAINVDVVRWDACKLPLPDQYVDAFITDLPFGKRIGSRVDNWQLYPCVLREMARVSKLGTGRACLLTQDWKCIVPTISSLKMFWRTKHSMSVNIGGLLASVYVLTRTMKVFDNTELLQRLKSGHSKQENRMSVTRRSQENTTENRMPVNNCSQENTTENRMPVNNCSQENTTENRMPVNNCSQENTTENSN